MKKFWHFLIGLTVVGMTASAQGLNALDAEGRRHGKWIVYLDENWKRVDESLAATCQRYTWYDHGVNIYPMGPCGKKGYRLQAPAAQSGNLPLLNGEYSWYDEKNRLSSVHEFRDGEYVSCREFYSSGELSQFFDYSKKCEGEEHGWTKSGYSKSGELKFTSPLCRDKNGRWPVLRD